MIVMSIGESIRNLRKKAGFTQKQLAEKVGVNEVTIRSYEAEKYNPKINTLTKLCVALDCKITDLIDEDSKKYYRMFDTIEPQNKANVSTYISEIRKLMQRKENGESLTEEKQLHNFLEKQKETNEIIRMEKISIKLHDITAQLNEKGQEKVIEHAEMIAKIPEYRKDDPPQE